MIRAFTFRGREEIAAERRWRRSNAEAKARGCPCGRPAEVATEYPVIGRVPFQWWTCKDHEGASSFGFGGVGLWQHRDGPLNGDKDDCPLGEAQGWMSDIGGPVTSYDCPHRTHDNQREG